MPSFVAVLPRALLIAALGVTAASCLRVPDEFPEEPGDAKATPATVAEVLNRHVAAIGGDEKVRAIKRRTVEARMIFRAEEGCEEGDAACIAEDQTGSFILQTADVGRLYRRTVLGELVEERGFDGKVGWRMQGNGALQIDTESEAKRSAEDAVLHWYFDVEKRGIETWLLKPRREDSDGNVMELDGIGWRFEGDEDGKEYWFDRSTGLLREERAIDGDQGQTIVYEDYREVDGVLVAYNIRVSNIAGDRTQKVEFITQRVDHGKLDKKKFAIPEVPDPDPQPDNLLTQLKKVRAAAEKSPKDSVAQIEWARTAFIAAHFDEALKAANATLKVDPKEPEALFIMARVQILSGRYGEALKTLHRAEKAGANSGFLAVQRSWIFHRQGSYKKLAKQLDIAGSQLSSRYHAFVGTPSQPKIESGSCVVEVPLDKGGALAVLGVKVGGTETSAIIDTGAADLIVTENLAKKLDITVRARSRVAEGMPEVGHGQVDSINIGPLELRNVPVNIFANEAIADMAGEKADKVGAVVGAGLLLAFQMTVDMPGNKLSLVERKPKCRKERDSRRTGKSVPFFMHETHYLYVLAKLDGAEGVYLLNTGMRGADLTATQVAYAHAGIGIPPIRSDEPPMVKVAALDIGDAFSAKKLESAFGYFEQTQTSDGFRLDGMLGLGTLGRKSFTLDYDNHQLYFH